MNSVEVMTVHDQSPVGTALLHAAAYGAAQAGMRVVRTDKYRGACDWLCLFGVGSPNRSTARDAHVKKGGLVACWDLGYWGRGKDPKTSMLRVSINYQHPQAHLDATPPDPSRFAASGIKLRDDFREDGHVVVAGMGAKSRIFLRINDWELYTLNNVQRRFPGRKVVYRPKPQGKRDPHINWPFVDGFSSIESVLHGASLAVCRHSNVAIDACIANIPVECEDGAAVWLYGTNGAMKPQPSQEARLDFLHRLAWWQWGCWEQADAWKFLQKVGHA